MGTTSCGTRAGWVGRRTRSSPSQQGRLPSPAPRSWRCSKNQAFSVLRSFHENPSASFSGCRGQEKNLLYLSEPAKGKPRRRQGVLANRKPETPAAPGPVCPFTGGKRTPAAESLLSFRERGGEKAFPGVSISLLYFLFPKEKPNAIKPNSHSMERSTVNYKELGLMAEAWG